MILEDQISGVDGSNVEPLRGMRGNQKHRDHQLQEQRAGIGTDRPGIDFSALLPTIARPWHRGGF